MTQQEKNLDVAMALYRSVDTQDFARAKTLTSPHFQCFMGGKVLDLPSWEAMGRMFMTAFPDGRHVFDLAEGSGDYVLMHGHFTGTHTKEFQGIPATGKVVKCSFTMIDKLVDGKLLEHRADFDAASLMQQLTQ